MAYSKYSAKPTVLHGIRFASKAESRRYSELLLLEKAGQISGIKLQPRFPLNVNGNFVCTYVADFEYVEKGARVIEDVKGMRTRDYQIKRNLLLAIQPTLDHREIVRA